MNMLLTSHNLLVYCAIILLLSQSVNAQNGDVAKYEVLFREAEVIFNQEETTEASDRLALSKYQQAIHLLGAGNRNNAATLYFCQLRIGEIHQIFGREYEALSYFHQSLSTLHQFDLDESLKFDPLLWSGNSHYFLNDFDSAIFYFEMAEKVLQHVEGIENSDQLYNSLGAIYYESGNYQQSINYFEKALALAPKEESYYDYLLYGYRSNIATCLRHLEQYDSAATLYISLIELGDQGGLVNLDELFFNLSTTYLEGSKPDSALTYLQYVNIDDGNVVKKVIHHLKLGQTYFLKNQLDSAKHHLQNGIFVFSASSRRDANFNSNDQMGRAHRLLGDIALLENDLDLALKHYQLSIIKLHYNFNPNVIFDNPVEFNGGYSSFSLFESQIAKANALKLVYDQQNDAEYARAVLDTYESAFKMAEYVSKSFDNDDARLFLSEKVFEAYQKAVDDGIELYEKTKQKSFLEKAFYWSEKSKASTLALNLKENEIRQFSGLPDSLLEKEHSLKFQLSRLFLQLKAEKTSGSVDEIRDQIRDIELELSRLKDRFHDFADYYELKFRFDSLDIDFIEEVVLSNETALLTYFFSNRFVYTFMLDESGLYYTKSERLNELYSSIQRLTGELRNLEPGRKFRGNEDAKFLGENLIKPLLDRKGYINSLIIIPHLQLYNLPFESLLLDDSYLIERFDVSYQFAASLLKAGDNQTIDFSKTLTVTPFDNVDDLANEDGWSLLPASKEEANLLTGIKIAGKNATKQQFLFYLDSVDIIHLATHAFADNEDPNQSFIVFYPELDNAKTNYWYTHEMYATSIARAKLAFLSACETGAGRLVNSEGLMSLSRSFAYAGCPNMVTSLWKAEDYATAYLSQQFYGYLQAGKTYSKALQLAKIDLLNQPRFAQFHAPTYWSHLVFIGMPNAEVENDWNFVFTIFLVFTAMILLMFIVVRFMKTKDRI